jgi:hypothetical protein
MSRKFLYLWHSCAGSAGVVDGYAEPSNDGFCMPIPEDMVEVVTVSIDAAGDDAFHSCCGGGQPSACCWNAAAQAKRNQASGLKTILTW